jgi:lipopolysaccharide transport system permease protein
MVHPQSPSLSGVAVPRPRIVVDGSGPLLGARLRELWRYRELLGFLVWRDIRVQYAQTAVGAGWALLQPLLTMVIFTVIFGRLARQPSDGVPYALFSLAALVPWMYFSAAVGGATSSVTTSTNLISKVYFPRLIIPTVPVVAGLVNLAVSLAMTLVLLLAFRAHVQGVALLLVPLATVLMIITACGVGYFFAAINVRYRDIRHVVPFLLQVWMFASPVVYSTTLVPEQYRALYAVNPMVSVIDLYRSALLGTRTWRPADLAVSASVAALLFLVGTALFFRNERSFADVA